MFVKIVTPSGEFKKEGFSLFDSREKDRDFYLNLSAVTSIHVISDKLYFDRLRITFESNEAAQNAITALFEAMGDNNSVIEISRGVVTVKALSGCGVCMENGGTGEVDNGPAKPESVEADETEL